MRKGNIILSLLLTTLMAFTTKTKTTIFTIGDSTMAKKNMTDNPERGWGQFLPLLFYTDDLVVDNHAENGRSTKSFIDEGLWDEVINKAKKGDYIFIQFGHNDEKSENSKLYADAKGDYRGNLTRFVNETKKKGAYPVLMTSVVRRKFDENGLLTNTHGEYPDVVRSLAAELDVPLIDMEKKSRKIIQQLGSDKSKKMFVWVEPGVYKRFPRGRKDDTHFSEYGAAIIAKLAAEGIRELKLPIARYLKDDLPVDVSGRF